MRTDLPENSEAFSTPRISRQTSPRVLILRAGAIGDTLMVTPLVRALRRTFPDAYLAFVCSRQAHDVLRHNPHLDQIIPLAYRHLPLWLSWEKLRALGRLRRLNLDWALALESHPSFLDLARCLGAATVIAYGALPQGEGFQQAGFDPTLHCIENHLRAAQPLNLEPAGFEMELDYPSALDEALRRRLDRAGISDSQRLVGIHPGWGGRKPPPQETRLRSWPPDRFAHVIDWLAERAGAQVVLTGSAADRPLTDFIARLSRFPCLNLAGDLSLLELAALIHRLDLCLSVDSGPAHMAAALGTPLVTLWGPGIFEQTTPLAGRGPVRILYHRVPCAPCYGTPLMKSCQDNICMKQIEVAEVREAVEEMWASSPSKSATPPQSSLRPRA
jgi:ADP-heptose:LPS heptosyltransferase